MCIEKIRDKWDKRGKTPGGRFFELCHSTSWLNFRAKLGSLVDPYHGFVRSWPQGAGKISHSSEATAGAAEVDFFGHFREAKYRVTCVASSTITLITIKIPISSAK